MANTITEILAAIESASKEELASKIQQLQCREEVACEDRDKAQIKFEKLASLLRQKARINKDIKELLESLS